MNLIMVDRDDAFMCRNTALVSGSSLIFADNFKTCFKIGEIDLKIECLQEQIGRRVKVSPRADSVIYNLEFIVELRKVATFDVTTIPLNLLHPYNYFHFLIECLPSLNFLLRSGIARNSHAIISGILHPNMREALAIVTKNRLCVLEISLFDYIESTETIIVKESFLCNERVDGRMPDVFYYNHTNLLSLRECFLDGIDLQHPKEISKIFIVRESAQRNITNMADLVAEASKKDFIIVNPTDLTFHEQVRIFNAASVIIGPTGAWLANLMFVRAGVNVTVLYPETCRNTKSIWKGLGEIFGVNVTDQFFPVETYNQHQPIHSDFYVDIPTFTNLLDDL